MSDLAPPPDGIRAPYPRTDEEERALRRALFFKRITVVLAAVVAIALLAGIGYVALAIRVTQKSNTRKNDNTAETLRIVKDCVDPNGTCAARGRDEAASAVGQLSHVVILAAACSAGLPRHLTTSERETQIQACVIAELARSAR